MKYIEERKWMALQLRFVDWHLQNRTCDVCNWKAWLTWGGLNVGSDWLFTEGLALNWLKIEGGIKAECCLPAWLSVTCMTICDLHDWLWLACMFVTCMLFKTCMTVCVLHDRVWLAWLFVTCMTVCDLHDYFWLAWLFVFCITVCGLHDCLRLAWLFVTCMTVCDLHDCLWLALCTIWRSKDLKQAQIHTHTHTHLAVVV